MARVILAWVVVTCLSCATLAGAQEPLEPQPDVQPQPQLPPLAQPPAPACTCCSCGAPNLLPPLEPELVNGPSQAELEGALAGGVTALAASYVLGVLVAWREPHTNAVVDRLPIIGPVASAARNAQDDENVPLLLFSAGVQAMSAMVIAAAATDLAALRRVQVSVGAGPDGCGMTLTTHF